MELLINNTYKMTKHDEKNLYSLGFKPVTADLFMNTFSVYKYKKISVLLCSVIVDKEDGTVRINVSDNNGNAYSPFYDNTYGNAVPVLNKINYKINCELKKLGIKKVKERVSN